MVLVILFCGGISGAYEQLRPIGHPAKLSDVDKEKLKRIIVQFQNIQLQAQPLVNEQTEIYDRNCKAAKIDRSVCVCNPETGEVQEQKPAAAKK